MRTDYPGSESSGELPGAKVPGNFRSRERKFSVGTFAPRSENTEERKVPEPTGQCAPAGRKEATGKAVTSHSLYANSPACLRNVFPRIVHSPRIGMSAKRLVRELARPRKVQLPVRLVGQFGHIGSVWVCIGSDWLFSHTHTIHFTEYTYGKFPVDTSSQVIPKWWRKSNDTFNRLTQNMCSTNRHIQSPQKNISTTTTPLHKQRKLGFFSS